MTPTNELASPADRPKRSLLLRLLFGFLWLVAFYFLTNMLIGGIVGGMAGASSGTGGEVQSFSQGFHEGQNLGRQATRVFFQKYGLLVLLLQVVAFGALCAFSVFPGIGKYSKSA